MRPRQSVSVGSLSLGVRPRLVRSDASIAGDVVALLAHKAILERIFETVAIGSLGISSPNSNEYHFTAKPLLPHSPAVRSSGLTQTVRFYESPANPVRRHPLGQVFCRPHPLDLLATPDLGRGKADRFGPQGWVRNVRDR